MTDLQGYHLARDDGTAIWLLDTLMHVKASTDDTMGAFTLIEALIPSGFGTPLHLHRDEEEGFYVLQHPLGEVRIRTRSHSPAPRGRG